MQDDRISITTVSQDIRQMTGQSGPGYRKLHTLACDGKIPAHKVDGKWVVYRRDMASLINALGLVPAKQRSAA